MDFNSLFRKFFHLNSGYPSDPFLPHDNERNERNDDVVFHDNFESVDLHINLFQQIEDMFTNMFSSSSGMIGIPRFDENLQPQITNPRNFMIKDPDDEEICDSSLYKKDFGESMLSIYDESGKELLGKPHSFSYSKFSSIKTVHLPDGTVEEHRTVIDNNDNKTTTVRRTIGDTSHEVTTKSDKQGIKEKEENFMNMDENELERFEQRWDKLKNGDTVNPVVPSISLPESSPSYLYLLKKFFGPFQKDELKWI